MGNEDLDQPAKIHHVNTLQELLTAKLDVITNAITELKEETHNYITASQLKADQKIQTLEMKDYMNKQFLPLKTQFKIVWGVLTGLTIITSTYVVNLVLNLLNHNGQ